jgi:hypothetical protein
VGVEDTTLGEDPATVPDVVESEDAGPKGLSAKIQHDQSKLPTFLFVLGSVRFLRHESGRR